MSTGTRIEVQGHRYDLQTCSAEGSVVKAFSEYNNTGKGIYKTLGVGQKVFEAGVYFSSFLPITPDRIKDLTFLSSWISGARNLLIVPKLISNTGREFVESSISWFSEKESLSKVMYAALDLTSDFVSFLRLFRLPEAAKFLFKKAGAVLPFILTSWDLKDSWKEYNFCSSLEAEGAKLKQADDREKISTYVKERHRYIKLSMASDIMDFALSAILLSGMFFGLELAIPAVALWGLGATAFFTKYTSDLYDRSMTYHLKEVELEAV